MWTIWRQLRAPKVYTLYFKPFSLLNSILKFNIQRSLRKYSIAINPIGIQTAQAIPAAVPGSIDPLNEKYDAS